GRPARSPPPYVGVLAHYQRGKPGPPAHRPRGRTRPLTQGGERPDPRLSPLAGLVVTGGLLDDDAHAVVGVDERDEGHQRRELIIVIVLGRVRPGVVRDTTGGIGDAGALLSEFQSRPLGLGEDRCLPPRGDQV